MDRGVRGSGANIVEGLLIFFPPFFPRPFRVLELFPGT